MNDTRRGVEVGFGVFVLVAGLYPTLAALDVIPTPDAKFGAPRWIVLFIAQPFVLIGLGMTLHGLGMRRTSSTPSASRADSSS